jgi:hypothetical protein
MSASSAQMRALVDRLIRGREYHPEYHGHAAAGDVMARGPVYVDGFTALNAGDVPVLARLDRVLLFLERNGDVRQRFLNFERGQAA